MLSYYYYYGYRYTIQTKYKSSTTSSSGIDRPVANEHQQQQAAGAVKHVCMCCSAVL
jgi:hypothetical protein